MTGLIGHDRERDYTQDDIDMTDVGTVTERSLENQRSMFVNSRENGPSTAPLQRGGAPATFFRDRDDD